MNIASSRERVRKIRNSLGNSDREKIRLVVAIAREHSRYANTLDVRAREPHYKFAKELFDWADLMDGYPVCQ